MGPVKGQGETLVNFWKDYAKSSAKTEFSAKEVANFSTSRVHLSAGSIVKRISTESETEIRPGGFFAAYKDEDVNRYKAVLPVYWKMWGIDKGTGGHVMSLKAKEAIKAPSEKETFEMFKEVLEKADPAGGKYRDMYDPNYIRTMLGKKPKAEMPTEELARKLLRSASANWNNNDEPLSKAFFEHVRSNGFNALIDMNDAGHLSSQPLRLLDGSMFDIAGSERLTPALIKTAQETLVKVAHAFNTMVKTFLAHGVKPDFVFRY